MHSWFHVQLDQKILDGPYCTSQVEHRVRSRFFEQVGQQTTHVSSGNKRFFTKSCHCKTYQNDEQPPRTSQNSYFQSHFSMLKIAQICPKNKNI